MSTLLRSQLELIKQLGLDTQAGMLKEMARLDPGFFERFTPRRIVRPDGYPDSRAWTQGLFSHLHSPMDQSVLSSHAFTASVMWTRVACRFGFPVLHLAKDLAQAFHLTGIDEHIDISALKWPFPAFVLVLPVGHGIKTADSGEAQHILAPRLDEDSYPGDPFSGVRHTYSRPPQRSPRRFHDWLDLSVERLRLHREWNCWPDIGGLHCRGPLCQWTRPASRSAPSRSVHRD